ncbi:MAG: protein kinase [Proteobacteria bacterium]|nr:protein kinase [Pseudomonadota bacterium]
MIQTPPELAHKYRYIDLLGEGANGKTYLARTTLNDERVAIKALKLSQIENFKSLDLFQREAEVLESLSVQGVPTFHEAIIDSEGAGVCYLVQQYIDAPSIQSYLDQGRIFTEPEALILMRALTDILSQLEKNYRPPIIHRDIKPSNILCHCPGKFTHLSPYLIDFGAVANPQKRQQGSTVAGTIGYMAPEQIVGDSSVQADYYALGATVLHMLTGVPPYQIPSELFVLQFEPVLKQKAPATSPYMTELLSMLLQKEPSQRPKDIDSLIQCIDNVMRGKHPEANYIKHHTFKDRLSASINHILNRTLYRLKKMATTEGYITDYYTLNLDVYNYYSPDITTNVHTFVEFTYEARGDYFTNICIFPSGFYNKCKDNLSLPIKCTVTYDPRNRAFSTIDPLEFERIAFEATNNPKILQNIPEFLYQNEEITIDEHCDEHNPLEITGYKVLCFDNQNNYWIARNTNNQRICDIITFDLTFEDTAPFIKRVNTHMKHDIKGFPQTLSFTHSPTRLNKIYLAREHIYARRLQDYLDNDILFSEQQVLNFLLIIANILKALHTIDPNLIVGTLQPETIRCDLKDILEINPNAKIWLMSFHINTSYEMNRLTNSLLVFGYISPEQLLSQDLPQSDYYALGATALYMLTLVRPYEIPMKDFELQFEPIIQNKAPYISKNMIMLLKRLLAPKPENRLHSDEHLILCIRSVMAGHAP